MSDVSSPIVLSLATFSPLLGVVDPVIGEWAQQISAVGVMAYFLWRETRITDKLLKKINELQDKLEALLRSGIKPPDDKQN